MAVAYGLQARMTVADRFLDVLSHNWQIMAGIPGVHRAYPNAAASVRHGLQLAPSELKSYHSRAAQRIEAMRMGGDLTQMATDTIALAICTGSLRVTSARHSRAVCFKPNVGETHTSPAVTVRGSRHAARTEVSSRSKCQCTATL